MEGEHPPSVAEHRLAVLGERQPPADLPEQRSTALGLEPLQLTGSPRRRYVRRAARPAPGCRSPGAHRGCGAAPDPASAGSARYSSFFEVSLNTLKCFECRGERIRGEPGMHPPDPKESAVPILDVKFSTPIERDLRAAIASTLSSDHRPGAAQEARAHRGGGGPDRPPELVRRADPAWPSSTRRASSSTSASSTGPTSRTRRPTTSARSSRRWSRSSARSIPRATSTSTTSARTAYGYGGFTQELRYIRSRT